MTAPLAPLLFLQQNHVVIDKLPPQNDSAAWVSAVAAILFGIATIALIWRQVCVMKQQNLLIRWQHEHDWMRQSNAERVRLIELTKKLHIAVSCLEVHAPNHNEHHWRQVQDTAFELAGRLHTLDAAAYSTQQDAWFIVLLKYADEVLDAVAEDYKFNEQYGINDEPPAKKTIEALKTADTVCDPVRILTNIQMSIRVQFSMFKAKWDEKFPS